MGYVFHVGITHRSKVGNACFLGLLKDSLLDMELLLRIWPLEITLCISTVTQWLKHRVQLNHKLVHMHVKSSPSCSFPYLSDIVDP